MALLLTGVHWSRSIGFEEGSPVKVEAAASEESRPRAQIEAPPLPSVSSPQCRREDDIPFICNKLHENVAVTVSCSVCQVG